MLRSKDRDVLQLIHLARGGPYFPVIVTSDLRLHRDLIPHDNMPILKLSIYTPTPTMLSSSRMGEWNRVDRGIKSIDE